MYKTQTWEAETASVRARAKTRRAPEPELERPDVRECKLTKEQRAHVESARPAHKAALAAIEHAFAVAGAECVPRFTPLGHNAGGRIYFAVTPGVVECSAVLEILEGGVGKLKMGRRRAQRQGALPLHRKPDGTRSMQELARGLT